MLKSRPFILVVSFIACVLALALFVMLFLQNNRRLSKTFENKHESLMRLVALVQSNQNIAFIRRHASTIAPIFVLDDNGAAILNLDNEVKTELQKLVVTLGCEYVARHTNEIIVAFPSLGIEDLYPGGVKVLAYCSRPPATIVRSIDQARRANRGKYGFYEELGSNWYIKYQEVH